MRARNIYRDRGHQELAQGIQNIVERRDIDNSDRFVLNTETSFPYLQDRILRFGNQELDAEPGSEEDKLAVAFEFFLERIREHLDETCGTESTKNSAKRAEREISRVRDKILSLRLISVELDSEDDAYLIFETLNTRGKDLTSAQMVKNLFARLLRPKNRGLDPVSKKWGDMQDGLDESAADLSMDSFLLHYWISKHEYVSQKTLYKSLKKGITKDNAKDTLDELVKETVYYRTAFEPTIRKWAADELPILHSLDGLSTMRVRQPAPLVLAILRCYFSKSLSRKNAVAALSAIESFHFTYTAVSSKTSSGGMSAMYGALAQKLSNSDNKNSVVPEIRRKLRERWPTYDEFASGFRTLRLSEVYTKDRRLVRYVLDKLDRHARGKPDVNRTELTIEHLTSQTGTGQVDAAHVAMIGNLCLVPKLLNEADLGNKSPASKSPILTKARIPLLDSFHGSALMWDSQKIAERTDELAKLAFDEVWNKP